MIIDQTIFQFRHQFNNITTCVAVKLKEEISIWINSASASGNDTFLLETPCPYDSALLVSHIFINDSHTDF